MAEQVGEESNPYQAPAITQPPTGELPGLVVPKPWVLLVVVLLAIAAAGLTFFCTCLGLFVTDMRENVTGAALFGCGLAALAVYVLVAKLGLSVVQSAGHQPTVGIGWPSLLLSAMITLLLFAGTTAFFGLIAGLIVGPLAGTSFLWWLHQYKHAAVVKANAAALHRATRSPTAFDQNLITEGQSAEAAE